MKSRSLLAALLALAPLFWIGCGDDDPTRAQPLTDEQAIRQMLAGVERVVEAHDVAGFMAYVHPDFLHWGTDRAQLEAELADAEEGLPQVRSIAFDIDGVTVAGDRAMVSMQVSVEFNDGSIDVMIDPSYGGIGLGWLARLGNRWLLYGAQKHCNAWTAVGHTDESPPDDYVLELTADCAKPVVLAEATGPGMETTLLWPLPWGDGQAWGDTVVPSTGPAVGDPYTFHVVYMDETEDSLTVAVRSVIDYLPPFTATSPAPGAVQLEWVDNSSQVPQASHYRVWAKSDLQPDAWGSDDLPLTQTAYTFSELTSGYTYKVRLEIYDFTRSYACQTRWVTVQ